MSSYSDSFGTSEEHLRFRSAYGDCFEQFRRNGRWGTCVDCPIIEGKRYPELCVNTTRGDHTLTLEELAEHYRMFVN